MQFLLGLEDQRCYEVARNVRGNQGSLCVRFNEPLVVGWSHLVLGVAKGSLHLRGGFEVSCILLGVEDFEKQTPVSTIPGRRAMAVISGSSFASVLIRVRCRIVRRVPAGVTCIMSLRQLWRRCRVPSQPYHRQQPQMKRKPPSPVLTAMVAEMLEVRESKRKS